MHAKVLTSSGSSGFRVGETDRGAPLGEQRSRCRLTRGPALRVPVAVMGATEKSEVPRIGAAAQRMRDDVVDLDQMR